MANVAECVAPQRNFSKDFFQIISNLKDQKTKAGAPSPTPIGVWSPAEPCSDLGPNPRGGHGGGYVSPPTSTTGSVYPGFTFSAEFCYLHCTAPLHGCFLSVLFFLTLP